MSMLSARCDELRELALWLNDEFYDVEAAKVRDAADTILELRDDLQRTNAENAKLRQQLADVTESVGRLEERCAELRKLSADQYQCSLIDGCYECEWGFDGECVKHLERRMKELGVKQ